jgi:hypothetical protein
MIHSDPTSAITTRISVNISAMIDQPSSDRVFMCRKYTMCTVICTIGERRDRNFGRDFAVEHAGHDEPERYRRQDHRQDEPGQVAAQRTVARRGMDSPVA